MKIRSDSTYAELTRLGHLDEFFAYVATQAPSYEQMRQWLSERGLRVSLAALHNLVTYHMRQWRVQQAISASSSESLDLPADIDQKTRDQIRALKLDLAMSEISVDQQLTLIRLEQDQSRIELASRKIAMLEARERSAKDIVGNAALTDEQRMAKIKEIFGM
jgi:hypothetical protein